MQVDGELVNQVGESGELETVDEWDGVPLVGVGVDGPNEPIEALSKDTLTSYSVLTADSVEA